MGNLLRQLHGASRWQIQRNSECAWFVSVGRIALLGVRVYLSSITTTAISDVLVRIAWLRFHTIHEYLTDLHLVCRHWNQILLAEPLVWSKIVVGEFYTPPPVSLVETWLERSANVPITIVAQSPNSDEKDEKLYQYYLSLFSVLKFHLARWGSLTVNVSSHVLPTILPTAFSAAAQLLKLEITAVVGYLAEGIIDLVPLLDTAPSLRHLRYELDFVKTFEILPNPYSLLPRATTVQSLVHFELSTALTLHSMLRVLGECQTATHVTLKSEFLNWQNDPHANEPPLRRFQLPHLQSLVLKVSGTECHLLDLVHCPNLKLLNLNYFDAQSPSVPQNLRPLYTFLANAPESLQVLVVYAFGNVTVEVLKMFSLSRLYNLRIVEFAPLKPLTQEAAEGLRMKIRDEGKDWELKFAGAGWSKWDPRVALGWVDVELHRQWQDTLRDLRVNSFLVFPVD